jgi:hypothetical protein
MASAVGSTALDNELVIDFTDAFGEPARVTIPLDGAMTDANIALVVDDYAALSNAIVAASVRRRFPITGIAIAGKPASAAVPLVAAALGMEFQKVSPLNAAIVLTRQVLLPAYIAAILNSAVTPHVPVTTNATLNALTALLAGNLDVKLADGNHYPGSWTFNPGSKFGTKLTVTDGL